MYPVPVAEAGSQLSEEVIILEEQSEEDRRDRDFSTRNAFEEPDRNTSPYQLALLKQQEERRQE